MKKQKLVILCLLIYFVTLFPSNAFAEQSNKETSWPTGPNVHAEAAIVMEASTGLILYEKNIHSTYYPASITKILTSLVAIENSSLSEVVTFSKDAVFGIERNSSHIGIDVGEELTMQQCLHAILLASANEVSNGVAEHVAGSISDFADMMNEKAESLGCLNSNFVNPHGLPDDNHYTSAYDMALIMREAMKNETFRKISSTRTYQIPPTNIQEETRYLRNHHRFILNQDYIYEDCTGGKTGYTDKARFTLVSSAKRGDLELICVILKDDISGNQYIDSQNLLDFGFDNFSIYSIADSEDAGIDESLFFTKYNSLLSNTSPVISTDEEGYLVLPNTASYEDAVKKVEFFDSRKVIDDKNIIGTISYEYHDKYVGSANILFKENSNSPSLNHSETEPTSSNSSEVPSQIPNIQDNINENNPGSQYRPIIIGAIIGVFVLIIALYFVFVERRRIKKRNDFLKKRENRKLFQRDDYLDL